jgi:hypothetical protein
VKKEGPAISPWIVGVFIFIVVGSAIFQIIQSSTAKSPFSGNSGN